MGLTERIVRDAKPEPKTRILWDSTVKGLGLRVTPAGAKAYVLNYRVAGRERRATLARCSEVSLRDVRDRAGRELAAIRDGAADPLRRRQEAREAPTVADLWDRFERDHAPARMAAGRMAARTLKEYRQGASRYILPALGRLPVRDVARRDVERMVRPLSGRPQHNRILALASRLFTLAETWELRPQHTNPARGIERAVEAARDRVLAPSELAALSLALATCEAASPAAVASIRFAAVTGLRIGEILAVRWEHVDFESGRLTMPETKTGRRVHDLPAAALAILAAMPRINGNPWAFTGGRARVAYGTARRVFACVVATAGLSDVRLHDLRRTVMTSAAAAGIGTHVLRDLLGHKTTAMADRYVRAVGNPVREAREQVGAAMAAMMAGKSGEVVRLRSAK